MGANDKPFLSNCSSCGVRVCVLCMPKLYFVFVFGLSLKNDQFWAKLYFVFVFGLSLKNDQFWVVWLDVVLV